MKKTILTLTALIALTGSAFAGDFWGNIQRDFSNATQAIKNDIGNVNAQSNRGADSSYNLQGEINAVKAQRDKELEPIKKQISEKEAQMRKVIVDTKLSVSQKKAKTTLLQKEINTLKTQQENIEEKYRQKIREFRD